MSNKKIMMGILAGAAIGAIAGVLLAPDKGSDTRKKIASKGKDLRKSLQKFYAEAENTMANAVDKAKGKVEDLSEKTADKINSIKAGVKNQLS